MQKYNLKEEFFARKYYK